MTEQIVHNFSKSKQAGDVGETLLDSYFSTDNHILTVPLVTEKEFGIDRVFLTKEFGILHKVEYKTDARAADTGNLFLEIWSNKEAKKKGWLHTSKADIFMFYVPGNEIIYEVRGIDLEQFRTAAVKDYRVGSALNNLPNGGGFYRSEGLLVPLQEISDISYDIHKIGDSDVRP
jgi:hypothetical protein